MAKLQMKRFGVEIVDFGSLYAFGNCLNDGLAAAHDHNGIADRSFRGHNRQTGIGCSLDQYS